MKYTYSQAIYRLREIGVDDGLASMELTGCTEAEHYEWICTADAEEIRQYRARMLRDAEGSA